MKLFNLGLFENHEISPFLAEKIYLTNKFTTYILAALSCYFVVYLSLDQRTIALSMLLGLISLSFVYWANSNNHFLLSRHILMITCNLMIMIPDILFHQKINAEVYFLPASLVGFLVFSISEVKFITLSVFWPIALWLIPRTFQLNITSPDPELTSSQFSFLFYTNFAGAYAITTLLVYTFFSSLVEFQKRLIVSNKFVALGEMSGGIAHEINNPLAVILGKTTLLERKLKSENLSIEDLTKDVKKIEQTAERISKIVRGLKNFSRSGEMDPMEPTPVTEILEDVMNICQDRMNHHGVRYLKPETTDVKINCRQHEISQVILNLLNNSTDAIAALAKNSTAPIDMWVQISIKSAAERIHISITDCGPGIPSSIANKMMDPFFTTKPLGKGTGLGLSISKGIIEAHQGHFYYDPQSKNTRFVIDLPKHSEAL